MERKHKETIHMPFVVAPVIIPDAAPFFLNSPKAELFWLARYSVRR